MAVKKNKKEVQSLSSRIFNTKGKIIGAGVITALIFLAIFTFMIVEGNSHGKMIINNKTDLDLEYIKTTYVDEEGTIFPEVKVENVNANDKSIIAIEPANLLFKNANLEVRFKVAGNPSEFLTDVGFFNEKFDGTIKISLTKTDDPNLIKLTIKAKSGFFSSKNINCNESALVNLSEGLVLD